jgi:hypothetical protein
MHNFIERIKSKRTLKGRRSFYIYKLKGKKVKKVGVLEIIFAVGVPSGITAFCFWLLEHKLDKREEEREKKEKIREQQEVLMVKSIGAALALGEATAEAVARIPDAHCNGDMHAALEYARKIKHEQKDFLTQQSIEAIF